MVRRDTRAAKARVGILAAKAPTAPQVERLTCYSMIYLSKKKKKKCSHCNHSVCLGAVI